VGFCAKTCFAYFIAGVYNTPGVVVRQAVCKHIFPDFFEADMFGDRLKQLRTEAGMSQAQLAEATQGPGGKEGLSVGTIRNIEQGIRREPSWRTVQALADALGVATDDFREPADRAKDPPTRSKHESPSQKRTRRAGRKGYRDMHGT
jgi:transcriptional regulator with XRE-family HTH domain